MSTHRERTRDELPEVSDSAHLMRVLKQYRNDGVFSDSDFNEAMPRIALLMESEEMFRRMPPMRHTPTAVGESSSLVFPNFEIMHPRRQYGMDSSRHNRRVHYANGTDFGFRRKPQRTSRRRKRESDFDRFHEPFSIFLMRSKMVL